MDESCLSIKNKSSIFTLTDVANSSHKAPSFFRKKKNMAHSGSFIIILKYYFELHEASKYEMLQFQLLNKRCYETHVPKLIGSLRFDTAPCILGSFEPNI